MMLSSRLECSEMTLLMADVLEGEGNLWKTNFRTQQIIVIVLELGVGKMVPPVDQSATSKLQRRADDIRAGITIQ